MKLLIISTLALLTTGMSISINTLVYVQKSGIDGGGGKLEYVTVLRESGRGQASTSIDRKSVPGGRDFLGTGFLIADRTFSGLPSTMEITVYENDGGSSRNDGVCRQEVTAQFGRTPTVVRCLRELHDGRLIRHIILIVIRTV